MAPTPQPTMTREQQQALARARARARISTGAGLSATNPMVAQGQAAQREYAAAGSPELPADNSVRAPTDPLAKRSIEPIKPSPWSVSQSSYDEMAASPQRSVVGEAPQWATEAPLMGGRTIQDEGREALQSAGTKFRVNTSGTQLDNRHNADGPDLAGGIGDLLKAGNFAVRDWWKNSSYKDKENLIASIPIEATGAGAIARLSDHIGQKTGNDFLKDKTGNFTTDASYDPVAELEMYLINAGTWSTRNAAGGAINPRAQAAKIGPQLPAMRQALAKPTLAEFATPAADVATNFTMGLSDVTAAGVRGAVGLVDRLQPKPGAAVPQPAPAATGAPASRFFDPAGNPVEAEVIARSENGGVIVRTKDGREVIVGEEIAQANPNSPDYVPDTIEGGRKVSDLSDAELEALKARSSEKIEAMKAGGQTNSIPSMLRERNAAVFEQKRRAGQSAPVAQAPIPQAAPRAAQAGPSGAGQGAAAQPVLNATPVAAGQNPVAMAKSDARIIGRLLKAGGVPRNDVNNLLAGLVQAYQGSNSSRLPLAFFAEEYLPTVLPKQTADDVIQKLRGFGRERYSANGPKDSSRSTMRNTVDTLRSTQQDNLSGVMDANLYKGKLIGQEDKLNAQLEQNARTAYTTALENANNRLLNGKATQAERDALGEIQALLHNGAFLKEVPAHLRIKAMRDGINLEDYVQKDPIAAAHWLQSELRQAVTAAEGVGGMATSESRLYGEMRTMLLELLEKVVLGYRGARKAHGDIYGAKEAIEFGGNFFKSARSEVETARLARQFKAMSVRQKTAATMSIRDALKNEFRNKAEDTAAKVTRLQQAGVLDALETVLGADGKRVADAIRNTVKENERIRAVDMMSGSNTADNLAQMEAAQEAVRSPVNKAIGSLGDNRSWAATLTGDALLAVNGLPPVLTGGKIASSAVGKLGKPSARKLSSVTKTLYDLPAQPNALSGPPKPPKVSGPRAPKPPPEQIQATLDDLLNQYSAIDHRANPAAGQKLLRQIERLKKQLATPNALSPPPRPPVKAGFGGSSQTNMPPELGGAIAGGAAGYAAAPEDQKGAGAVLGGLGGAGVGRLARGGLPNSGMKHALRRELDVTKEVLSSTHADLSMTRNPQMAERMRRSIREGQAKVVALEEAIKTGVDARHLLTPREDLGDLAADARNIIDGADRGLNAMGGLISGGLGVKAVRSGAGAVRNAMIPQARVMAEAAAPASGARTPPNALATPPRPPVKAGFGSSKPPAMDEGARLPERGYEAIRIGPATVEITRVGDEATINRLKVPEGERGKGAASRALDAVLRQADAEGVTLFLTPERIGDSGLSDAQLKAFYTRHGFASNRGRDRSFSTMATMVRKPRAPKSGSSKPLDMSEAGRMQRAREEWGKGYQVFEGTHATSADFDAFDPTKIGQSDPGWYGRGHYFARADKGFKEQYSRPNSKGFAYGQVDQASSPLDRSLKEGSRNIPVLIRMKKPFTDDAAANPKVAQAFWDAGYRSIERDARNGKPRRVLPPGSDERRPLLAQDAETFSNVAKSLGYDGANWGGEIVVFPGNEANIRSKFAQFDPSQSGSSKLLAGMGASPEGLGAAAGGAAGYVLNPTDANGDGVIDDADRGLNAMGGLISGGLGVKAVRSGANAVRNAMIPQARVMAEAAAPVGSTTIRKPTQAGFLPSGSGKPGAKPPANALAGPPKPKPVEARREAPRGTKSFSDPRLSPGENKTAEMVLNGYTYDEIADEAMTSVDVIKRQAMLAQRKLGDDVKLPRPGMGKRPPGSTKRDAANSLFGEGLDNATIAQRTGLSIGNVRTYRSYWKEQSNAPVASVEGAAYNPPAMPERPFEADYPQQDWPDGPPVDAQGRLTRDRDGRPLDQTSVIIGRNKAPGYGPKSEADRSLRDRIAVIQTLKKAGSSLKRVPRSPDQTSGAWLPKFNDKDRYTGRGVAQITDDLDRPIAGLDDQEVITLSHELAHSIDFKTRPASDTSAFNNRKWGIDHKNPYMTPEVKAELESQLQRIYQDLNNPIDGEVKIRTPKDHGYESIDADRELWAEAIRAYMYDPNYIKTVAPDVAFMIRDNVNKNGSLRKTIQFNAVPTIVGVGGLGLGAAALNGQPAEAQTRPGGLRANALASQYGERPGR